MILAFTLSMPQNSAWNGKWSGEGKLYAKVENLGRSKKAEAKGKEILEGQPYSYYWDDGWTARIGVAEVDVKEARKIRNASQGFCGYDWMVTSIILDGRIQTATERKETEDGKAYTETDNARTESGGCGTG